MQIRELEAVGCERIYRDRGISGSESSRPEVDRMLYPLGSGDEVVDNGGLNTKCPSLGFLELNCRQLAW